MSSPAARAHLQAGEVLGARALLGEQASAHVDAPAAGAVLADAHAADQGVDGGGHVLDRDAEVGGAGAVGHDAQLGHAELVVGVEVDHRRRWRASLLIDLLRSVSTSWSQSGPRTENSTGKPRWAVKPGCERSCTTARTPGYGVQLLAQDAAELRLGELVAPWAAPG